VFFDRVNSKLEDLKNKNILGAEISLKKIEKNTGYYFSKFAINTNLYLKPQNIEQDQEKQKPKNLELKNNSTVLKIDKKNKRNILKELDLLKINKRELFPEMEYASSYMRGNLFL
jgi:hypothetical protein